MERALTAASPQNQAGLGIAAATDGVPAWDAVVLAGGGCRCFWQVGFWSVAGPALGLAPRVVGAVSAGSAMACVIFAGVVEQVLDDFARRTAENPRNVYPRNWLQGRPVFPHERIYRGAILANLDAAVLARLHRGPDIRVLIGRPPSWLTPTASVIAALIASEGERMVRGRVHATWPRRIGFRGEVASVRDCDTPEALADLILHSSCVPPVLPHYRRGPGPILDGGIVDSAPVEVVGEAERVLVLLTRPFPESELPRVAGRTYVQPSRPTPVSKWDYASPALIRETFDLGRRDGEDFAARWEGVASAPALASA